VYSTLQVEILELLRFDLASAWISPVILKKYQVCKYLVEMMVDHKKYALIIIDMQNDFVLPDAPACVSGAYATVPCIKRLLKCFRANGWPVFHVIREYRADGSDIEFTRLDGFLHDKPYVVPGTKGCDVVDGLAPLEGEYRIVKNRFSGFMNTELDFVLRRLGVRHLVICGTQYPNCIRATIFDAIAYGYPVINIVDATSAQTQQIAEANILDLKNIGVDCITLDKFLTLF
jgi:nicotinamidase-related amidase